MQLKPKWVWREQLTLIALFVIANVVAYEAGPALLPKVGWPWIGLGLFFAFQIVRAAVLRACGRPLFGH